MRVRELDAIEVRVLGALLEKERTTPDYYPMTVNALLAAVNQKTNRDPVTALTEGEVLDALDRLRQDVLVWRSDGARVERWRQTISRRLELEPAARALMTLLMLRGPQTAGELRSRSGRLHEFAAVAETEAVLCDLAAGEEPLVTELARAPGQKESRWAHLLSGPVSGEAVPPPAADPSRSGGLEERVAALEEAVSSLTRDLSELLRRLDG